MDKKLMLKRAREIWDAENIRVFNGKLPPVRFFTSKLCDKKEWAAFHIIGPTGKHRICFSSTYIENDGIGERGLHRIVLHEAIHALQYVAKSERTKKEFHGRFFRYHAFRILAAFNIWVRLE